MTINISILGTSSMVPTKQRNVSGLHIDYNGEGILVDCGEGSQRQMNILGINRLKIRKILISHWHGDHVAGMIGLIQTMGDIFDGNTILDIYGPKGSKERMEHLMKICYFDLRIKIKVHELNPIGIEKFYENEDYYLECTKLSHGIPCIGYSLTQKDKLKINMKKVENLGLKQGAWLKKIQKNETIKVKGIEVKPEDISKIKKGKKVTFILDTKFNKNLIEFAEKSDLLISEATYGPEFGDKAKEYKHMTSEDAATIAKESASKKLVMTHISQRYKTTTKLLNSAQKIFPNSIIAEDLMKLKV